MVFNLDQVEDECLDHLRARPRSLSSFVDYDPAEKVIAATQADIRYGGNRAFYSRTDDFIQVPLKETFEGLKELESDPKAIFRAATQASKAADFILSFSRPQQDEATVEGVAVEEAAA